MSDCTRTVERVSAHTKATIRLAYRIVQNPDALSHDGSELLFSGRDIDMAKAIVELAEALKEE